MGGLDISLGNACSGLRVGVGTAGASGSGSDDAAGGDATVGNVDGVVLFGRDWKVVSCCLGMGPGGGGVGGKIPFTRHMLDIRR